jgi:hypothetical protein
MDNSTNITKLLSPVASAALIKAISEVQPPKMDAVNPRFGSSYATLQSHLEALREPFLRNGWAILQHPANSPGAVGVTTMLIHTSGEGLTFEATIPVNPEAFDAQKAGSVYSYLRRYSLAAIGLTTGDRDDDAEVATPTVTHGTGVVKYAQAVVLNSDKVQSHNEQSFKRKSEPSKVPGTWREVVLHFGKNKGTKLGDLPASSLDWYAKEWQPKPYNGKISDADIILRGALDSYLEAKSSPGTVEPPQGDDVPF